MTETEQPPRSRDELWRSLSGLVRRREARWLSAEGLVPDRVVNHAGLMRALEAAGLTGVTRGPSTPRRVVVDWTSTETCTAEGVALFAVLGRQLKSLDIPATVCGPPLSDVALLLETTGLRGADCWEHWVETDLIVSNRVRALGPAGVFGGGLGRGNLDAFLDGLSASLGSIGTEQVRADLIEAVVTDMIQNSRAHVGDAIGSVVALVEHRRRPARVQIGLADTGSGIPEHLLRQPRYDDLAQFTDFTVVSAVLDGALTGRPGGAGGGFSRLASRIVRDFGGEVCVRSGGALLSLSGVHGPRGARLTTGWGTQVRVVLPTEG